MLLNKVIRNMLRPRTAPVPMATMTDTLPNPKPLTVAEYEKLDPRETIYCGDIPVTYCVPNRFAHWRVQTLFTKEPHTIEWINTFAATDVFVDIGANVGMYSIWAAKTRGTRVFAFEPESQNYALLNRNIWCNDLGDRVSAYCLALSDGLSLSQLHLSQFMAGGSCHTFGAALNFALQPVVMPFRQGALAIDLDTLIARNEIPVPQHIKLDVDGLEHKVIAGAGKTLTNPGVKSVLIEINENLEPHRALISRMRDFGFGYSQEQVNKARRADGTFKDVAEYVFFR